MESRRTGRTSGINVQVCWEKFANYWDVEMRLVPMEGDRFHLSADEAVELCDENTIGVDVPLAGTIAVVVFVTAYVPFIGAFVSGAFAVILTLSAQGTTSALIMLVVVILANGLLQNIVQPVAFGATLDLNPLVVLIVTIGFGAIFGMIGMVLAAPLTSAALHITRELAEAKALDAEGLERPPPTQPVSVDAL
jgi:hypothetical protein